MWLTARPLGLVTAEKPTKLHFTTYLTHLELEETPLLLHLLCDFSAGDLRADHPVLFGVLSLLLLDLCTETDDKDNYRMDALLFLTLSGFTSCV